MRRRLLLVPILAVMFTVLLAGTALADYYHVLDGYTIGQDRIKARIGTPTSALSDGLATRKAFVALEDIWYSGGQIYSRTAEVGWAFFPGYGTPKSYLQYTDAYGNQQYELLSNYPNWGDSRECEIVHGTGNIWYLKINGTTKATHYADPSHALLFRWGARTSNATDAFNAPMTQMQSNPGGGDYTNNTDSNAYGSASLSRVVYQPYYQQTIYR